jgi:hypothetical protein
LVGASGATLNAIVDTRGLSGSYVFQYGTSDAALGSNTAAKKLKASTDSAEASVAVTGLKSATKYYYRVVVTTDGGTGTGDVLSFTTE